MTTATLSRVPVDKITREAADVKTGHALLSVIAGLFFAVGFVLGKIVPMVMWCSFAVREGYRASHGPSRKMQIAALTAQVADMKIQLSRFDG